MEHWVGVIRLVGIPWNTGLGLLSRLGNLRTLAWIIGWLINHGTLGWDYIVSGWLRNLDWNYQVGKETLEHWAGITR